MRHPTLTTYGSVFWLRWMQNRALNVLHVNAAKIGSHVCLVDHPQSWFVFGLRSKATWDSGNISMMKQEKLTQTVDGMQTERPVLITPSRAKLRMQTAASKKKRRITGPIWPTCSVCVGLVSQLSGATLGQSPPWSKGVSCTTGTVLTNGWLYSEHKYSPIFWHRSLKHAHKLALASHLCHGEFWYSGNTMWSRRASSTIT